MVISRTLYLLCLLLVNNCVQGQVNELYDPDVLVQPLEPKGFKVSIPHQEGIKLFAFHGNLNVEFDGREIGTFARDIPSPSGGRWTFIERNTRKLQAGDVIHYWIYVDFFDGIRTLGHTFDGSYTVTGNDFIEDNTPLPGEFIIPPIEIEPLSPRGLRASIPDQPGIKLFAFHLNVNKPMNGREAGDYARDITRQRDERWTFLDKSIRLRAGDTLYYWYYVVHEKRNAGPIGYTLDEQTFTVEDLVIDTTTVRTTTVKTTTTRTTRPPRTTTLKPGCEATPTKFNGGRSSCKGQLIFQENFGIINPARWQTEIRFAGEPDYEFVSYSDNPEILSVKKSLLTITPKLAEELYGPGYVTSQTEVNLGINCTGEVGTLECVQKSQAFLILPPVVSGRINTSPFFSFKYGIVEIRAKLPKGNWIYPELYLTPKRYEYGSGYNSGEIKIAFLPGNEDMNSKLYGGAVLGSSPAARKYAMRLIEGMRKVWNDDFHVFSVKWSPDSIKVFVDDEIYGNIEAPEGGFASLENNLNLEEAKLWRQGSPFAPFDQDMVVTLGVGVGGHMFADGTNKPWVNNDPKAQRQFYTAKTNWKSTWSSDSVLQVDYVKVWAL